MRKFFLLFFCFFIIILSCKQGNLSSFKKEIEKNDLLFGAAVEPDMLKDSKYRDTLVKHFNLITAENVMKWETIHPEKDRYDFAKADELVEFALKNDMTMRGHVLVWHFQNPEWLEKGEFTREELLEILEDHIKTVVTHFKGKVAIWDVVNECLEDTGYRETLWYNGIGPEYIQLAFIWAHEADPDATLVYNEYSVSELGLKSDRMLEMVTTLKNNLVPIDRVGFQLHLDMANSVDFESIYMNIARFENAGIPVDFTELDIRFQGEATDKQLDKQATYYKRLLEMVLAYDFSNSFTVWGVSDANSWIPDFFKGYDHALLFDKKYKPKPAFYAIQETLKKGPVELSYAKDPSEQRTGRTIQPAFKAIEADTPPAIDGDPSDAVWEKGIKYPFAVNQLEELNCYLSDEFSDVFGEWVILYKGNTIYGRLLRTDEMSVTSAPNIWENDNLEVFFSLNNKWAQLRSMIGNDFSEHEYQGNQKAVWNSDNTVCEFSVELPLDNLAGQLAGWNIALSDNDGGEVRQVQAYPINGKNQGWQGKGFGNIIFIGNSPMPPEKPRIIMPFQVNSAESAPIVDGNFSDEEWQNAAEYGLVFNQLNENNQMPNSDYKDLRGSWGMVNNGNIIYGFVKRQDDVTKTDQSDISDNDHVELVLKINDEKFYVFQSVAGKDFEKTDYPEKISGKWSGDGSVFEFSVSLPSECEEMKFLPFNIALADNDGSGLEYKLFPMTGSNASIEGKDLSEIQIVR